MKAIELIEEINKNGYAGENTCDTLKAGDAQKEIKKVGVTMFATVETVRSAMEWGADMLIVHEPTYYEHMEKYIPCEVVDKKKALIDGSGMVVYRYHDHMHNRDKDEITEGELHFLGIKGDFEKTPYFASYTLTLDTPITATELALKMEKELGIAHVRIAGERNKRSTRLALCFGTPGGVFELLRDESIEIVLTGEACEWMLAEYARDAAALGINKTLIVMGHLGSERDGMRLLAEKLSARHENLEIKYFESGEVYSYTDKR